MKEREAMQLRRLGPWTAVGVVLLCGWYAKAGSPALKTSQVRIAAGTLEGVISTDDKVRTFKGIPYAAPPVGELRWKDPQPAAAWRGVRKAVDYGARCMQGPIYSDMIFTMRAPVRIVFI
jgi:para-nitrobenzyl esterase